MTKDYALLIGKKFGDREVLDITRKHNGKWNAAFAICKCKCGSIAEIPMNQLKAGRRSRCPKCAEKNENKSTGIRHISYDKANDDFIITIERNGQRITKHARTLDEAILIKKQLLKHFETYGCFDVEKLKNEHATSKCNVVNVKKKSERSKKAQKDYSYLIGQKLGDWTIVDVDARRKENERYKYVHLQNNAGDTHKINLYNALRSLQNTTRAYRIKGGISNNTGVKYVCYHKKLDHYVVQITHNKIKKTKVAKSLEEAIKIKERILKEFEEESATNG